MFETETGVHRFRVLVIDDDAALREAVEEVLAMEGYEVISVPNGRAALAAIRPGHEPHLALVDMMMPDMNGWEFVEEVRGRAEWRGVRLAAFSAVDDVPKGIARLAKPVDLDRLVGTVDSLLHASSAGGLAAVCTSLRGGGPPAPPRRDE
jgi:CheY-like chemotaxis protein